MIIAPFYFCFHCITSGKVLQQPEEVRKVGSKKREQLLIVTKSTKGTGTENNPYIEVMQFWTLDGELLNETEE